MTKEKFEEISKQYVGKSVGDIEDEEYKEYAANNSREITSEVKEFLDALDLLNDYNFLDSETYLNLKESIWDSQDKYPSDIYRLF